MKIFFVASAFVTALLVSGCAHTQRDLVLAPVGPTRQGPQSTDNSGTLVVYSAYDQSPHFYDFEKLRYSDYKIFSADGKLFRKVHNDNRTPIEGPVWVGLPPGNYRVLAPANKYGDVTVPVLIESHQVTTVHLEGGDNELKDSSAAVRLPNGQIVGWQAAPGQQ